VRSVNTGGTTYSNGSSIAFWSFTTGSAPSAFNKANPVNGATNQPTSLTISWGASSGATSYEYCYDTSNDGTCSAWTSNGTSTSKSISGLSTSTTYYWHIRAVNSFGTTYSNGSSTAFWSFTTGAVPGSFDKIGPANGAINQSTSLTLSWGTASDATLYEYCYDTTNDNACSSWLSNGTSTSKVLSGLAQNTTYYWHVRAVNSIGVTYSNGGASAFWSFTTTVDPPAVFYKTSPANGASGQTISPLLGWSPSLRTASYEYCYDTVNNNSCDTAWNSTIATSVQLSNLSYTTTYYWHVRAVNTGGVTQSNNGTWWMFKTQLPTPTLIYPTNGGTTPTKRPTFEWNSVAGASNYTIQVSKNNTFTQLAINVTATNPNYTHTADLVANTLYYWHVKANGVNGASIYSETRTFTTGNPPSVPTLTAPANNALTTDYSPFLNWSDSTPNLSHYELQIASDSAFATIVFTQSNIPESEFDMLSNLTPNTKYYWRVRAYNSLGHYSAWSASRYFRTALLPPVLVSPANSEFLLNKRPAFDWSDAAGATNYTIQVSKNSTFTQLVVNKAATASAYTHTVDLLANTLYYWRVRANGTNGPSLWSDGRSFTTGNPPSIPVLVAPANNALTTNYTPLLDWKNSTLPIGTTFGHYEVQVDNNSDFSSLEVDADTSSGVITDSQFIPISNLASNTKFYWRVRSVNDAGEHSAWSVSRYFRTALTPPVLTAPTNGSTTNDNTPTFTWNVVPGAATYTIQVSKNPTFTQLVLNKAVTMNTYTPATVLPANITLYWRVKANGINGPSLWSSPIWSFTITP
jgi:hypothetical protein